jgi:hypothetical protein
VEHICFENLVLMLVRVQIVIYLVHPDERTITVEHKNQRGKQTLSFYLYNIRSLFQYMEDLLVIWIVCLYLVCFSMCLKLIRFLVAFWSTDCRFIVDYYALSKVIVVGPFPSSILYYP